MHILYLRIFRILKTSALTLSIYFVILIVVNQIERALWKRKKINELLGIKEENLKTEDSDITEVRGGELLSFTGYTSYLLPHSRLKWAIATLVIREYQIELVSVFKVYLKSGEIN